MNIAINALLLSRSASYRSAGISQYIYELLRNLRLRPPEFEYEAVVSAGVSDAELTPTPNFRCTPIPAAFERPTTRILWEQLIQPLHLAQTGPTLHHALGYALPLGWPGRSVITICDLSFLRFPELFNRSNAIYLSTVARLSARRATHVITISESTRRDVIRLLGVPANRVTTTYCGVTDRFKPRSDEALNAFRSRLQLPERFLLYVGTIEPRKNVAGLVRAYARYRSRDTAALPLILAGGRGWKDEEVFNLVSEHGLEQHVRFPGFIPTEDLPLWYAAATAFIYPSRYEGFGLPVAEAMACGTPVVTSTSSSIPEVVGDAGLLVDPDDDLALAEALEHITSDAELRGRLSFAGRERAARFQWKKTAAETVAVYERLVMSPAGSAR